jgi:hypothetical protein
MRPEEIGIEGFRILLSPPVQLRASATINPNFTVYIYTL